MGVAAGGVACGAYNPHGIEFRFTPVPYTVTVNVGADGTPVAFYLTGLVDLGGVCVPSSADELTVSVNPREQKDFERWLDDIGFSVRWKHDFAAPPGPTTVANPIYKTNVADPIYKTSVANPTYRSATDYVAYEIGVPLGSAPDALAVIKQQPGVRGAGAISFTNDLLLLGSMLTERDVFFGCATMTVKSGPSGTPVAFYDAHRGDCGVTAADQMKVILNTKDEASFERWLGEVGFTLRVKNPPQDAPPGIAIPQTRSYLIGVPAGSVPDARALIAKRPGVLSTSMVLYTSDLVPRGDTFIEC
jgi:hypothetical protein